MTPILYRKLHRHINYFILYILIKIVLVKSSYKEEATNKFVRQTDQFDGGLHSANSKSLFDEFAHTASTDESKLRLALLVDEKIDRNKDGLVQLDELVNWLRECQDRYAVEDVNRHWVGYGKAIDDSSSIGWQEYTTREYDHMIALMKSGSQEQIDKIKRSHEYHLQRDLRRWKLADINQDERLNRVEFKMFLYPEHSERMHDVVVDEKFHLLDKDKDGKISGDEYLSDLSPEETHLDAKRRDEWLASERTKFYAQFDLDHDNYLDKSELASLITKSEIHDQVVAEAKHLMQSADADKNHRLTKEEILLAYHEFVNSHATDFGEALRSHNPTRHDEL